MRMTNKLANAVVPALTRVVAAQGFDSQ